MVKNGPKVCDLLLHAYTICGPGIPPESHPDHGPDTPQSVILPMLEGPGPPPVWCPRPCTEHHPFQKQCLRATFPASCVRIITPEIRLSGKPNVFVFFSCPFYPPLRGKRIPWRRNFQLIHALFYNSILRASALRSIKIKGRLILVIYKK